MELLTKIVFWSGLFVVLVKSLQLGLCTYPRIEKTAIGWDVLSLLLNTLMVAWAWNLLWGVAE